MSITTYKSEDRPGLVLSLFRPKNRKTGSPQFSNNPGARTVHTHSHCTPYFSVYRNLGCPPLHSLCSSRAIPTALSFPWIVRKRQGPLRLFSFFNRCTPLDLLISVPICLSVTRTKKNPYTVLKCGDDAFSNRNNMLKFWLGNLFITSHT